MKKLPLMLFCFALMSIVSFAQIINIPDPNFKAALIASGIDKNNDGQIQLSEAQMVDSLVVGRRQIKDLTGIELFTNLKKLICGNNQLTKLDLSKNKKLQVLDCSQNVLKSIDLRINTWLSDLTCSENGLTKLDITQNDQLLHLDCSSNQLTELDLTVNEFLQDLLCNENQLTKLDLRKIEYLKLFDCTLNPKLVQICVTKSQFSDIENSPWIKDKTANWNTDCK